MSNFFFYPVLVALNDGRVIRNPLSQGAPGTKPPAVPEIPAVL